MIDPARALEVLRHHGFDLYTGVACSLFRSLVNAVIRDEDSEYIEVTNEGDAVALAAGAQLAGRQPVALMQNSGLGNAVNPLTSLAQPFEIPFLLVVTWRGQPETDDEPQHRLMGEITPTLLSSMGIAWEVFPRDADELGESLIRARAHMEEEGRPYALLMERGTVARLDLDAPPEPLHYLTHDAVHGHQPEGSDPPARIDLLRDVVDMTELEDSVIVASTGYTGRELWKVSDRPNHLYMVGSMGCALPLGLGIALGTPRRVVVLDGDGALLMRLGAMATVGRVAPPNLVHLLFDNSVHLSTGGQPTAAPWVDFSAIAAACGYAVASDSRDVGEVLTADRGGPAFARIRVAARVEGDLPRPSIHPSQVADRLRTHLRQGR